MSEKTEYQYVTDGKLNAVIYELKSELKDVDNRHTTNFNELRHDNVTLNNTLKALGENIQENSGIMKEIHTELKETRKVVADIQSENITRDHILDDLKEFKVETAGKLSGKFSDTLTFFGIVAGVFGTVTVAIIQVVAPMLFR